MGKPKTTRVPTVKAPKGDKRFDSLNAGIANLNKTLAGGITGVEGVKGKVYFTPQGATDKTGTKKYTSAPKGIANTTGVAPNPKNTDVTEPGVISSTQGESTLKQYQTLETGMKDGGLGTKESPLNETQLKSLGEQGYTVGSEVPGRGKLNAQGYFEQPVSTGTAGGAGTGTTTPEKSFTYINADGSTQTTTGPNAGSAEEQKKMKDQGYTVSESTAPAESIDSPEIIKLKEELQTQETEIAAYKSRLTDLIITDPELKADIRGITKAYDARIAEMRDINNRQIQSVKTLGYRMGMQFTGGMGGMWGGIISDAERQGLLKIADIEGEKQSKILEAKAAARESNYKIYAALMDDAREIQKQKTTALADLVKAQKEQDAELAKRTKQIAIDSSIAELYADGTTSPEALLKALNQDSSGNFKANVTAGEVEAALKVLTPPDEFKGMDSDLPTFEWLKANGRLSKDMTFMQYKAMLKNLEAKASGATEAQIKAGKEAKVQNTVAEVTQLLTGIDPKTGNRYIIPGVTLDGQPQYFVGPDGYIGAPGLRFILNRADINGVNRSELLPRIAWSINPDHLNKGDLLRYGITPEEIVKITGVEPIQYGDIPTTKSKITSPYGS